jgi:HEAT repeats/Putative zinc-finger
MICHQVQTNLSLYLYGELDFATEETVEEHLLGCAFCQQALAREKSWHATLNSGEASVPLNLLADCRQELRQQIAQSAKLPNELPFRSWRRWWDGFHLMSSSWPARAAAAILLMVLGFGAGRWADQKGFSSKLEKLSPPITSGMVAPYARVRNIEPGENGRVRLVIEHVQESELTGSASDDQIRKALLTATSDPADPALRVDSLDYLRGQTGDDVRNALLTCVRTDRNAAVRLKALEALRSFPNDPATRRTLVEVLKHDDNAGVRAEAIDVLLPPTPQFDVTPDLLRVLQQVSDARQENDYVRQRCQQALETTHTAAKVY